MAIFDNIRKLAKEQKITITKIEQDNGFARGLLCKWNNVSPTITNVKKVADYLGVTVDDLIKDGDTECQK